MLFPGKRGLKKRRRTPIMFLRRLEENGAEKDSGPSGGRDFWEGRIQTMKVAVFGAGNMGLDIAQVFAAKDHDVVVRDISDELIKKGEERLKASLKRQVEKGRKTQEEADAIFAKIVFTTNMRQAADADLIVEAIV